METRALLLIAARFRIAIFFSILLFNITPAAYARSISICIRAYQELSKSFEEGILDSDQIQKIGAIFEQGENDAAEKAYNIYLEARLQKIPPELREKVRGIVNSRVHIDSIESSHYDNGLITISKPAKFRHTLTEFITLAHETEHAIQDVVLKASNLQDNPSVLFRALDPRFEWSRTRFHSEIGAMLAEWEYLRALPRSTKDDFIKVVSEDSTLDSFHRKRLIRILQNEDMGLKEFINREHSHGAYPKGQLLMLEATIKATIVAGAAAVVTLPVLFVLGSIDAVTYYCLKKASDPYFDRTTEWFQNICMHLGPVKNQATHK